MATTDLAQAFILLAAKAEDKRTILLVSEVLDVEAQDDHADSGSARTRSQWLTSTP